MKRYLLILVTLSALIGGCGNDEAPKMKQAQNKAAPAQAMDKSPATGDSMMAKDDAMGSASMPPAGEAAMTPMAGPESGSMAGMTPTKPEAGMTGAETGVETAEADTGMMSSDSGVDKGKSTYDSVCFACHGMGVAGAPKLGDKVAWAPRIAKGMDTLVNHAINGFQGSTGVMPPKGGRTDLSDEDISAAVSYMVEQSQ